MLKSTIASRDARTFISHCRVARMTAGLLRGGQDGGARAVGELWARLPSTESVGSCAPLALRRRRKHRHWSRTFGSLSSVPSFENVCKIQESGTLSVRDEWPLLAHNGNSNPNATLERQGGPNVSQGNRLWNEFPTLMLRKPRRGCLEAWATGDIAPFTFPILRDAPFGRSKCESIGFSAFCAL